MDAPQRKPLFFIASARKDMRALPEPVQHTFGTALLDVQYGATPPNAAPLKGVGSAGMLEIREDFNTDTYRAVYTVSFPQAVYVLHVFQKKSKRGIATPKRDLDLVKHRYALAREHYETAHRQETQDG